MAINLQGLPGTGFNGDHAVYSNYFDDNHVIQQVCISQPKNLLIDVLRKYFSRDNVYTYRMDEYGFPKVVNLTDKDIDSEETTKILISNIFRYQAKFFPAIIIKNNGGQYKPISFNQNGTLKYKKYNDTDKYGRVISRKIPTHRVYAGAWNMNFEVTIYSESQTELEELVDITSLILQYSAWQELRANGLFINGLSIGSENSEPYANDYVYSQSISLTCYSEWRVEIPIENLIERLVFYLDFTRTPIPGQTSDADVLNLKYNDLLELIDIS